MRIIFFSILGEMEVSVGGEYLNRTSPRSIIRVWILQAAILRLRLSVKSIVNKTSMNSSVFGLVE